jgi:tetratricopeptide (TPR) repeat protein
MAESALNKGNVEEAISAFRRLMEMSDDPSFQDRLAQVYESQGETTLALENYSQLVERYRASEKWEEAASATERIMVLDPNNLNVRRGLTDLYRQLGMTERVLEQTYQLGKYYQDQGDLHEACQFFEQVLVSLPEHHEARRHLVEVYLDSNRVSEALQQSEALTEHYLQTQDHANAINLYRRLVAVQPENIDLREKLIRFYNFAQDRDSAMDEWLAVAQLHSRRESWELAVRAYQNLLEMDPGRGEVYYQLARIYMEKLQNPTGALHAFEKVYELEPGHVEAMSRFVRMLLRMGKADMAARVLKTLEKANPEEGAKVRTAILTDFRSRIENAPTDLRARFVYGELCFHLDELDAAIEQFQQTRRDRGYELKSFNMLGMCFAEKKGFNMVELAVKQFRKGLETPGHPEGEYLELRYNLAMLQYRNNRFQEALQELRDCQAVDITYRDVREWIRRIESEIAGGPKVSRR